MSIRAFLSCMFVLAGPFVMLPLMFSAWLYHIDPDGVRGWVVLGLLSYLWSMVVAVRWSIQNWPCGDWCREVTEQMRVDTTGGEDVKRMVIIEIRQDLDAHHFWAVVVGGNGELMWRTEEYTRRFSAKRAAKALFNRMKPGTAVLDL